MFFLLGNSFCCQNFQLGTVCRHNFPSTEMEYVRQEFKGCALRTWLFHSGEKRGNCDPQQQQTLKQCWNEAGRTCCYLRSPVGFALSSRPLMVTLTLPIFLSAYRSSWQKTTKKNQPAHLSVLQQDVPYVPFVPKNFLPLCFYTEILCRPKYYFFLKIVYMLTKISQEDS